jgi:tetratricopeptide (TPR) repeat protein
MATKKNIRSKQQYDTALDLEKSSNTADAIKHYQKATTLDPTNLRAWNRLMILYRKTKSKQEEITLVKAAIEAYKKQTEADQQTWLKENQEKAESTRELAKVLGLLEPNGMPATENDMLEKWQARLYLLEYRAKNARKKIKKTASKSTPKRKKAQR